MKRFKDWRMKKAETSFFWSSEFPEVILLVIALGMLGTIF